MNGPSRLPPSDRSVVIPEPARPLAPALAAWLAPGAHDCWIDGRPEAGGPPIAVHDPATEAEIATVPNAPVELVDRAVRAAARALAGGWRAAGPAERERRLLRLADLVAAGSAELEQLIVLENGKLLSAARREVEGAVRFIRYMAGWATKITGQTLDMGANPSGTGTFAYTRREPVGVVAGIIPWNMPLGMAAWKAIPALACGCTVVLKPASEAPLAAIRLAQLAAEAEIPPGALNVVTGDDRTGALLVDHPGVAKISFTGSTESGKRVGAAAMARLARVTLELGGKSPAIVLAGADLDAAAAGVSQGIFYNQGQVCAAGSRLLCDRRIFGPLVERVAARAAALKLGSGFDAASDLGPLVSATQRDRVAAYVAEARAAGAVAAPTPAPPETGYFVSPTVFTAVTAAMPVVREEIFGPVLVAMPFDTEDELVSLANDTRYGLAASIYSDDLAAVHRLIPRIEAGSIFVNGPARTDPNLPMGGVKESGLGREHGSAMIDLYTESKSVVIGFRGVTTIDLSTNESPLGPSPLVVEAIEREARSLHRYPERTDDSLREALAAHHERGLSPDHFFAAASASEVLDLIARAALGPGDEAIVCSPTFPVYATTVANAGGTVVDVPLDADAGHRAQAIRTAITPRTRLLYVCNPGNPTGVMLAAAEFAALLDLIPERVLVVADEVYHQYVDRPDFPNTVRHLHAGRNVVIVHSFSKAYGLAGLRLGYGIARPELAGRLGKRRLTYHLSRLALAAGVAALADRDHVERTVALGLAGRRTLAAGLLRLGVRQWPSQANFVLAAPADPAGVEARLARDGIRVRAVAGPDAVRCLRVSIGPADVNDRVLQAFGPERVP